MLTEASRPSCPYVDIFVTLMAMCGCCSIVLYLILSQVVWSIRIQHLLGEIRTFVFAIVILSYSADWYCTTINKFHFFHYYNVLRPLNEARRLYR